MPKTFRNVAGETLWVDLGRGPLQRVDDGDVLVVEDRDLDGRYMQTGETGEIPLWELVDTRTKKAAAAAEAEGE